MKNFLITMLVCVPILGLGLLLVGQRPENWKHYLGYCIIIQVGSIYDKLRK